MPQTFYIGIKGLIVKNNKILMLKYRNRVQGTYYWDLPGGRMEPGETIADALQRDSTKSLGQLATLKFIIL